MEENNLNEILNRYWLAETTIEEEKLIEEYMIKTNGHPASTFFLAKNAAKKTMIPDAFVGQFPNVRKIQPYPYSRIVKLAAILLIIVGLGVTMMLSKQRSERILQAAAHKQIEADLTLMFNTVKESYNDINSSANYLKK